MSRIRVLVIDDSAVVRQVVTSWLEVDPGLDVVGAVADPIFAMKRMQGDWPDVVVCDVEMPRMDGLTFLRQVMAERPTPIIMFSTLTEKGASSTLEALRCGAFAALPKPKSALRAQGEELGAELVRVVKAAAQANMGAMARIPRERGVSAPTQKPDGVRPLGGLGQPGRLVDRLIAIGASTGGTRAIEDVLTELPEDTPPIVIVQHMPEHFTGALARRLNGLCAIEVREAVDGDLLQSGLVLIAPGGRHLSIEGPPGRWRARVLDAPPVNRHRPSVDVLFRSVAKCAKGKALGIIMTGMGDDGARGLLEMRQAGANTRAQDESSCIVFGMPKAAMMLGAAEQMVRLEQIATEIHTYSFAHLSCGRSVAQAAPMV